MENRVFQKNDILTLTITDMDEEGQGIGKAEGFTLFVKDAIVGDTVEVKVMKAKKSYGFARLLRVITPSTDRIPAACPVARACGGCKLQELSYEAELKFKEEKIRNNLIRLGGFTEEFIDSVKEPIVGMEKPFRYRNKAQYPVGRDKNGKTIAGFYAGRTHDIIPAEDCLLGREHNKEILGAVLNYMEEAGVEPYDEGAAKGLVRHVLIREGFTSGEIMVCLVVNGTKLPKEDLLISKIRACLTDTKEADAVKSICLNTNTRKDNVIMGDKTRVLYGSETIKDSLCGLTFKISPLSFYQVNPVQAARLYEKAVEYADLTGTESVWDLYCGIGTISLVMAKKAKTVYGVEIIPEAIRDAKENAKQNKISNAEFFVGKAEEVLPQFYQSTETDGEMKSPDVIVVDPPRKGCDEKCLETMLLMKPKRIVYVSCDSATLARDLKILCAKDYTLTKWQGYDQFSRTVHVETVVLLSQQKPDDHIEIEIDLDEIDATSAEMKATYEEIRNWVQEMYGFHVTNLNIAQVKQKHGIIERENYNKSKSENSRQPGCPEEKIRAIENALKFFQMI